MQNNRNICCIRKSRNLHKKYKNVKSIIIDVRTLEEWEKGHISCAHRIPIHKEPFGWIKQVKTITNNDNNKRIIVYCRSGRRAEKAVEILKREGYNNVINAGGYLDNKKKLEKI